MIWITTGILLCKWRNPAFPEETARLSVTSLLLGVIECVFQTADFSASFTGLYFFELKINCGISVSLELLQFSETSSWQFCWCLLTHFVTPHWNLMSLLVWIIGSGVSTIFIFVIMDKIDVPNGLTFGGMAFNLTLVRRHKLHWVHAPDDDIVVILCSSTVFSG